MSVDVRLNPAQLAQVQRLLGEIENGANRAIAAALNKTGAKAKTEASKAIRQQVRLSASYVRERLQGPNDTPANKASWSNLVSKVTAPHRGLLLSHFLTKGAIGDRSTPIKVKVKPTGAQQLVDGKSANVDEPFLIRLKNSGRIGIAQRQTDGKLDVFHGPSLSQVLASKGGSQFAAGGQQFGAIDAIAPAMNEHLATTLQNEIARVLARFG